MVKTDRASMANSLEIRCPFLDHEFVEYAAKLPTNIKGDEKKGKIILRSIAERLIPKEIINKPKKGFGIPISKWFRDELSTMLKDVLLNERFKKRGLFDYYTVEKIINEHIEGKKDWSSRLWSLLILELWFRIFFDKQ
jgi:asparagine synthase (glutamine-hydrolysing)